MKSLNFEFLRAKWAELATLGGFAEHYAHADPESALIKLRTLGEQIVAFIYDRLRLPKPFQANFNDLLGNTSFRQAVPSVVVSKLHTLRVQGNKAAHGEHVTATTSLWVLREAHDLSRWLFLTYAGGSAQACGTYVEPKAPADTAAQLQKEKKAVLLCRKPMTFSKSA